MREGKRVDEDLSYSPSVLSLVLVMFLFPCLFRRLQHTVDFFVAGSSSLCFALCLHFSPAVAKAVAGYTNTNGLFFGVVVCATLALFPRCFSVVHLDNKVARNIGEGFCLLPGSLVDLST